MRSRRRNNQLKNSMIAIIFIAIIFMAIAYSLYSSELTIASAGRVINPWDVRFTDVRLDTALSTLKSHGNGSAFITSPAIITGEGLSVDVNITLNSRTDKVVYEIDITNFSHLLDAQYTGIDVVYSSSDPFIAWDLTGVTLGEIIEKDSSNGVSPNYITVNLTGMWNATRTSELPIGSVTETATITLNFEVASDNFIPPINSPSGFTPMAMNILPTAIEISGATTGGIGIIRYYYSINNGSTWLGPAGTNFTIGNLTPETSYTIIMKAVDNVGNETLSQPITVETPEQTSMPIAPVLPPSGNFFTIPTLPAGNTIGGSNFADDTFTFVLRKPATIPNGMNNFSFSLPLTNPTSSPWTAGQVRIDSSNLVANSIAPSLSSVTIAPGATINVNLAFQARMSATIDLVRFEVSYLVEGVRRNIYIDFYWIPNNTYAVFYENNGGIGKIPVRICTIDAACQLDSNTLIRPGHTFTGWSTTRNGSLVYNDNHTIPANTITVGSSVVIYARWH